MPPSLTLVHRTRLLLLPCLLLMGCMDQNRTTPPQESTDSRLLELALHDTRGGFARVQEGRTFQFPQDHGSHPRFKQERWQFSGNLQTSNGRQFAYQFTLQRIGLMNDVVTMLNRTGSTDKTSRWRSNHLYLANFSLSDKANNKFYQFAKSERASLGLADVSLKEGKPTGQAGLIMNIDNWTVTSTTSAIFPLHLTLNQQDISMDITLDSASAIQSNGLQGKRQQGSESGNASYTYTIPRLKSSGQIAVGQQSYGVAGDSWFDHDWGTAVQGADIAGMDQYSLQLADGRELRYSRLREGQLDDSAWSRGIMVFANDQSEVINPDDIQLQATQQWTSPQTGIRYPVSWTITLPKYNLTLNVTPIITNQELQQKQNGWQGAVRVAGIQNQDTDTAKTQTLSGYGYLRLEGYQ